MKQLTCEMCGSTDLIKQDGVFVCQTCGTKYSIEEAKKMMIEGTVDVTGSTVKVDTSVELDNLYQIARRAKADNNGENAAKYYDMILLKDPTSWEAAFYVVYFKAMQCKIAQIQSAAISVSNCEESVLELIKNHVLEDEQGEAVKEVMLRSQLIANILANSAKSHYDGIDFDIRDKYTQEYVNNTCAARDIMYTCGSQIEQFFGETLEISKYAVDAWKAGIEIHQKILPYLADEARNKRIMVSYAQKIGKYDPAFLRKYILEDKRKSLEVEISSLKGIISTTPTKPKWNGAGIVLILLSVVFLILGISLNSTGTPNIWPYLMAVAELVLGIWTVIPKKSVTKANRDKVASAKAELEKKEAELINLK